MSQLGLLTRSFLLLSLLAATSCLIQAQTGSDRVQVRGQVVDTNHDRVTGATITCDSNRFKTSITTDERGEFSASLPPGEYAIKVSATGFAESTQKLKVTNAGLESLEIVLQPAEARAAVSIVATDTVGYEAGSVNSATKTLTSLHDVPQSISVVTRDQIRDQSMDSIAAVASYVPGVTAHQGENNRDQLVIRGNSTSADFFINGARDDVQYYRDLYNVERVEVLKGPNAMIFGRGGGGGVVNRVTKEANVAKIGEVTLEGGSFRNRRATIDFGRPLNNKFAFRVNGLYQAANSFRRYVYFNRYGVGPSVTFLPARGASITLSYERLHDLR